MSGAELPDEPNHQYRSPKTAWRLEMVWIALLLVMVVLLLTAIATSRSNRKGQSKGKVLPYTQSSALFSPSEHSFLSVLEQAAGEHYRIFAKIRLADVLQPRKGLKGSAREKALDHIYSRHLDFILCDPNDLSIVCAIELDDPSDQRRGDEFLLRACRAANLPLLQIIAKKTYALEELRAAIRDVLERTPDEDRAVARSPKGRRASRLADPIDPDFGLAISTTDGHSPSPTMLDDIAEGPALGHSSDHPDAAKASGSAPNGATDSPACPKCGAPMVRRRIKSGAKAGLVFWGCSTFPKCRGARRDRANSAATQTT